MTEPASRSARSALRHARLLDLLIDAFALAAALILAALVVCVSAEVVMRYFIGLPTRWVNEFSEYALLWLAFLAGPWVLREEAHVKVEMLTDALSPSGGTRCTWRPRWSAPRSARCSAGSALTTSWRYSGPGEFLFKSVQLQKWAVMAVMPPGLALLAIQFVRRAFRPPPRAGIASGCETAGVRMEWWAYLTIILAALTIFFLSGLPIAFCFTLFNFIAVYFWMGGVDGFALLTVSAFSSIASFPLVAVPLFILMGELLFRSGVVAIVLDAVTKWVTGRARQPCAGLGRGGHAVRHDERLGGIGRGGARLDAWRRKCAAAATARRCRSGRSSAAAASP